jgi:hypothetical protein
MKKESGRNNKGEEEKKKKNKGKRAGLVHHIQTIYAISITIAIPPIHQFMLTHSQKKATNESTDSQSHT